MTEVRSVSSQPGIVAGNPPQDDGNALQQGLQAFADWVRGASPAERGQILRAVDDAVGGREGTASILNANPGAWTLEKAASGLEGVAPQAVTDGLREAGGFLRGVQHGVQGAGREAIASLTEAVAHPIDTARGFKTLGEVAVDYAEGRVTDPARVLEDAKASKDWAAGEFEAFAAEFERAAAQGNGAMVLGAAVGALAFEFVPVGKIKYAGKIDEIADFSKLSKTLKAVPEQKVVGALRDFDAVTFRAGDATATLTKERMKHILERHHPEFWAGQAKQKQTFFDKSVTGGDIVKAIDDTIAQNRDKLLANPDGKVSLTGKIGGAEFQLTVDRGKVVQFYPKSP